MVNFFSKKNNKPKPTSPGYYRCYVCNKKVSVIILPFTVLCKCEKLFCHKHRFPKDHECTYDYKSEEIEKLKKNLPSIVAHKVPNRI